VIEKNESGRESEGARKSDGVRGNEHARERKREIEFTEREQRACIPACEKESKRIRE